MTNKQLDQRIARAMGSLTTDLPFERIAQAIPNTTVEPLPIPRRRTPFAAIAACAAAVLVGCGLWYYLSAAPNGDSDAPIVAPPVVAYSAVIDIDVNPSVEITVDATDTISAVTAVNTDAALLVSRLDLTQQPLTEGVKSLFDAMVAQGYVSDGNNQVLVTVQSGDETEAARLHTLVNSGVDASMAQHSLTASVTNQTMTDFDDVAKFAQKHGISNGKAAFILNLVEQAPTLDAEALVDHAFSVLAAIAQHENVPLGELVDYDATDGLWEDILNALTAELTEAEHRWGSMLKISELKALALDALPSEHIAENALVVRIDFSWEEDEEPVYRIELVSLGYLYEYTVNARDGSFLNPGDSTTSTTSTADPSTIRSTLQGGGTRVPIDGPTKKPPKTTAPSKTTVTTTVTRPTSHDGTLTDEQAIHLVLSRLDLTEADVQDLRVGHHTEEISVSFIFDKGYVYAFYLDKTSGEETKNVVIPLNVAIETVGIDEWQAVQIALADAGVTKEESGVFSIHYGQTYDTPTIDVIWTTDTHYYHYRLDGVTGAITDRIAAPRSGLAS